MTAPSRRTALQLVRRPVGVPVPEDWTLVEEDLPELADGSVRVRVTHVSVDPAMRGWLDDAPSYLPPVRLGDTMRALGCGEVVESRAQRWPVGTVVQGLLGVQDIADASPRSLTRVDPALGSSVDYLGVLGQTGLTAYFGLFEIGAPRPGDTVVVSAAAGAVGSIVGQVAAISGCRVVGVAGGPDKCRAVVEELGYDECLDYRDGGFAGALAAACPDGIDVYFDNVGGHVLDACLDNLAHGARVVLCGAISQYNQVGTWSGPSRYWQLLVKRARMQGFLVFDYAQQYDVARARLAAWVRQGRITALTTEVHGGVADFPAVLDRLFTGQSTGKLVLVLASGP
ncbi:MAG: NADP-dependent oxidoreductase [Candidatus Nanopelagicales bacterium]